MKSYIRDVFSSKLGSFMQLYLILVLMGYYSEN